jgi:PKD repeat protein
VKLCHNTIDSNGTTVVYVYGGTATDPREVLGFEYAGNAARHNNYGMNGGFFTFGNAILNAWYPGYKWEANYLAGASASKYPAGTLVISPFENQFVDTAAGDYTVRAGSLLQGAGPTTAGLCGGDADIVPHPDIGADHGTLTARVANVRAAAPANVPTPPTAAVSVTCTYLDCAFSDQSAEGSAALARRSWRFGDGTESTDAAGTHTYGAAGTYTVRLIVWDANDLSDTYTTTVKVRPPNVAPTASFRSSCVDLVCTFTDTSVDPDGPIVAWAWTFGSSGTSTDAAPTFRFPGPGSYDVSLTVTDSDGATATKTAAVQITGILHVSFVDAVITSGKNGKGTPHWAVSATVEAHGADERVIPGATLSVTWDGVRTSSCITSSDGRCTFNSGALSAKQTSVTLTVLGVSAASSVYQPPANHDPAGNATGMSMTYVKP